MTATASLIATLGALTVSPSQESIHPPTTDAAGSNFVKGATGTTLTTADVHLLSGFGYVRKMTATGAGHGSVTFLPATPGNVYEITEVVEIGVHGGGSPTSRPTIWLYDANFNYIGIAVSPIVTLSVGTVYTITYRFSSTASSGVTAWSGSTVWIRPACIAQGDAGSTLYVRSLSTRDVTTTVGSRATVGAAATMSKTLGGVQTSSETDVALSLSYASTLAAMTSTSASIVSQTASASITLGSLMGSVAGRVFDYSVGETVEATADSRIVVTQADTRSVTTTPESRTVASATDSRSLTTPADTRRVSAG